MFDDLRDDEEEKDVNNITVRKAYLKLRKDNNNTF